MEQPHLYQQELKQGLEADFLLLSEGAKSAFLQAYGLEQAQPDFSNISLPQCWAMEIFILKNLEKADLIRRIWIIREKFRLLAGEKIYKSYLDKLPETLSDKALRQPAKDEELLLLKEDAANLIRQMQRMNYYRMQRNSAINLKKKLPLQIFFFLIVLEAAIFSYATVIAANQGWLLVLTMISFGMTGAVISLIQRLEQASAAPTNFIDSAANSTDIGEGMSRIYMISLIVSGAVFSVLVYLLSVSQWINFFELLPKPDTKSGACATPVSQELIARFLCVQFSPADIAKLLILSFISGFAERFVPDVLDSLIRRTNSMETNRPNGQS